MIRPSSLLTSVVLAAAVMTTMISARSVSAQSRTLTERVYFPSPVELRDSSITVPLDTSVAVRNCRVDVRGAMSGIGERPGLARAYWGLKLIGPSDTMTVTLRHGNSSFGDILDRRVNMLTVARGKDVIFEKDIAAFESSSGVYNTLRLDLDRQNGELNISGGGKSVTDICALPVGRLAMSSAVTVWSQGVLDVASLSLEISLSPEQALASGWTQEALMDHLRASTDPVEGYWQYLDRENDPRYARPGGRYLLAVVRNPDSDVDGNYDILYVDGAETWRDRWHPMMIKGRLRPTIFLDHYDLEWTDAVFETIDRDIHATITDRSILTLSFPLLKTTMRFSRMPIK